MRWILAMLMLLCVLGGGGTAQAEAKRIAVFVALCDNESQGIVPVPAAIGNGEDPDRNLYWGAGEGIKTVMDRNKEWKLTSKVDTPKEGSDILRERVYEQKENGDKMELKAYRGKAIKKCITDFETAIGNGTYDMVIYVGHNGLMEFELPMPKKGEGAAKTKTTDVIVLCCKSEEYFAKRIESAGGRAMLLTRSLMYPGGFLVETGVKAWLAGSDAATIRDKAADAYATNQKIKKTSALTVFANLEK